MVIIHTKDLKFFFTDSNGPSHNWIKIWAWKLKNLLSYPAGLNNTIWYFASIFYTLSKGLGLTAFCPNAPRNVCRFCCFLGCDTMTPLWEGILFFAQMWKAPRLLPCGRSHCSHLLLGPDEAGTTEHYPPLALASPQHPQGNRLVWKWGLSPGLEFRVQRSLSAERLTHTHTHTHNHSTGLLSC